MTRAAAPDLVVPSSGAPTANHCLYKTSSVKTIYISTIVYEDDKLPALDEMFVTHFDLSL